MTLEAIKYGDYKLQILDQLLLPLESKYVDVKSVEDGWRVINKMQVRGAPAIAIVGCLSLAVELHAKEFEDKNALKNYVEEKLNYLVTSRPTAVNMKLSADYFISFAKTLLSQDDVDVTAMKSKIMDGIEEMLKNDVEDNRKIGEFGALDIMERNPIATKEKKLRILTHCNTGSLATAGYGTALGVIRSLHQKNCLEMVYCTETRPYNQGARLTAYELLHENIPFRLITDSMVGSLMKEKNISAVVVGADRVAINGDVANKIGTYQISILAKHHQVPFYVAAPCTSIDVKMLSGNEIVIEERPAKEMTHIGNCQIAAEGTPCWNPAFDVTPSSLITAIVTERGAFPSDALLGKVE